MMIDFSVFPAALEGAVVRKCEVLFGAAGLADADPSPVASVVEGAFPLRALPAPPLHEAHARLELLEDKVQRAHVGLVLFACLGKAQKQHERVEVPFLGFGVVHEIRHERRVEQALRVLPERVGALAVLGGGVLDQAFDEDEDVRLGRSRRRAGCSASSARNRWCRRSGCRSRRPRGSSRPRLKACPWGLSRRSRRSSALCSA